MIWNILDSTLNISISELLDVQQSTQRDLVLLIDTDLEERKHGLGQGEHAILDSICAALRSFLVRKREEHLCPAASKARAFHQKVYGF